MTEAPNDATTPDALPAARIRRRRRYPVYVVWLVPLIAAVVAGVLVYERITEYGPTVTIMFRDATGLKPRQSEVRYRGVAVGEVSALELSPDLAYVVVTARVRREAANIAREGSVFWIVRPEVGIETVRAPTSRCSPAPAGRRPSSSASSVRPRRSAAGGSASRWRRRI